MSNVLSQWMRNFARVRRSSYSSQAFLRAAAFVPFAFALSGCLGGGSEGAAAAPSGNEPPVAVPGPDPIAAPSDNQSPTIVNQAPEIAGTPMLVVQAGQLYSFTPEATDADEDFLEFSIVNAPDWAQFSDETGTLTGTPEDAHVGETDEITITVTDGRDTRSIGPFRIRINARDRAPAPSNAPPTLGGTPTPSVNVNSPYTFAPTVEDADGDALSFSISNRPSWASFNSRTGALSGTPGTTNIGSYANIRITVSDGETTASIGPFTIQVRGPSNAAPTISGTPAAAVQVGQAYSFTPTARDSDSDTLSFSITNLPGWASFSTTDGTISGTPSSAHVGSYPNIVIRVSDGRASASLRSFAINVQAPANSAPTISGSPTTSVNVGTSYAFQPSASDVDGDTLGFTIQNRPSWASFNTSTGRLSGTPTQGGTHSNIRISVSDGRASATLAAFSITVNAPTTPTNRAPTISGTPSTSVNVGSSYSFTPSASDPDGNALTFSIQNRPTWASFNTSTGRLSGTPTASSAGTFSNITIRVSDGRTTVSLPAFSITVRQTANGSATLSWQPPTQNEDGTPLTNLGGYRISYGSSPTNLTQHVELANPGLSSYVVTGLGSGTWHFALRAYTSTGAESGLSNTASKTIP